MVELTNTIPQTLLPGESITFDRTVLASGCGKSECRDTYSLSATQLKANGIYDVQFDASVSATAVAAAILAIQVNGTTLPETTMTTSIGTANYVYNVATHRYIRKLCGECANITVTNIGVDPIVVMNPNLSIRRVS